MSKVLILVEAERDENTPHPEVGPGDLPKGWQVLPVDSNLWLKPAERKKVQDLLQTAATIIKASMPVNPDYPGRHTKLARYGLRAGEEPPFRPFILWDKPTRQPKALCTDGPWGRYLIRREAPGARWFIVLLNGKRTSYGGDTMEQAKRSIESIITQHYPEYRTHGGS